MMTKTKTVGNYVNSILAKREALQAGYDEAIVAGHGRLRCRGLRGEYLPGERRRPAHAAPDLHPAGHHPGHHYHPGPGSGHYGPGGANFSLDDLYLADEAFLTGTAAEVTPVREVDGRIIGPGHPGPLTKKLQAAYFDVVKGANPDYHHWLTFV